MKKYFLFLGYLMLLMNMLAHSQEIFCKVNVISTRVSTQVDKRIFTTLQNQLANLINNKKWTEHNFKVNERVEVNFIINIDRQVETNIYGASLTIQAARPLFNTSYNSPLVNWQDNDVTFRYVEFQPVEFNENRIGGTDGLSNNLTAILAYYVYIVLGMDYDSYAPAGGEPHFKKALFIVNNAPQGRNISGWSQFDGLRNRWWLSENMINSRYALFHDAVYNFYRNSLDSFFDNEELARNEMAKAINTLFTFNTNSPNTMMLQFFMQSKSDEIIQVFKKGKPEQRASMLEMLQKIDLTNADKYRTQLK